MTVPDSCGVMRKHKTATYERTYAFGFYPCCKCYRGVQALPCGLFPAIRPVLRGRKEHMQAFPPPRVAALHDLSCFGRCALTVIMPTLSVLECQTVPVPTALLSTHTGGFTDLYFRDLTPDMERISEHFMQLGVAFRAIYTGFLGSEAQIDTVTRFLDAFTARRDESGEAPLALIDPVMGDDGMLYSTYTEELVRGMRQLSAHADVLTPNITEACFLTDTPYCDTATLTRSDALEFANELLQKLTRICRGRIVMTGVHLSDGTLANVGRDLDGTEFCVMRPHEGHSYPGTGDIFASVLLGKLLGGEDFPRACEIAADFCAMLIRESSRIDTPARDGVALERYLVRYFAE